MLCASLGKYIDESSSLLGKVEQHFVSGLVWSLRMSLRTTVEAVPSSKV